MKKRIKKVKIPRLKDKAKLLGFSLLSATLLTLFVSMLTTRVDPSFFDSEVLNKAKDVLGVDETLYPVVRVSDGDTFVVRQNGVDEKIRLLGIDAPESRDPRKSVECFGVESAERLHELLDNQYVRLEGDSSQANRDRYGRLLRYVYLPDGTFLNELLLKEGYAFEYTYQSKPYMHTDEFIAAQTESRQQGRGLWGPSGCGIASR